MSDQIIEIDEDGKVTIPMRDCCRAAVQAENEGCAEITDIYFEQTGKEEYKAVGYAIRARTAKDEGAISTAQSESADPPTAP